MCPGQERVSEPCLPVLATSSKAERADQSVLALSLRARDFGVGDAERPPRPLVLGPKLRIDHPHGDHPLVVARVECSRCRSHEGSLNSSTRYRGSRLTRRPRQCGRRRRSSPARSRVASGPCVPAARAGVENDGHRAVMAEIAGVAGRQKPQRWRSGRMASRKLRSSWKKRAGPSSVGGRAAPQIPACEWERFFGDSVCAASGRWRQRQRARRDRSPTQRLRPRSVVR